MGPGSLSENYCTRVDEPKSLSIAYIRVGYIDLELDQCSCWHLQNEEGFLFQQQRERDTCDLIFPLHRKGGEESPFS